MSITNVDLKDKECLASKLRSHLLFVDHLIIRQTNPTQAIAIHETGRESESCDAKFISHEN